MGAMAMALSFTLLLAFDVGGHGFEFYLFTLVGGILFGVSEFLLILLISVPSTL